MESCINPLANLYRDTYNKEFKKLDKAMQDRVLACKDDNTIVDPEVNEFISRICEIVEAPAPEPPVAPVKNK